MTQRGTTPWPAEMAQLVLSEPATVQPDPTITGPCATPANFMCAGTGYQRLNPLAMLPNPTVSADAQIICLPCYEKLVDVYLASVHA